MKALLSLLLQPTTLAFVGVLLGLLVLIFRRRAAIWLIVVSLLQLWFFALPPVAGFLVYSLEKNVPFYNKLQASNTTQNFDYVIVMGGYNSGKNKISRTDALNDASLRRILEGVAVMKQQKNAYLIVSGGFKNGDISHADTQKAAAIEQGLEEWQIIINPNAFDTQSELRGISQIVNAGSNILIVSTATHIPRVKIWAEHYGMIPLYSGVGYTGWVGKANIPHDLIPQVDNLASSNTALHEYYGMLYAYILILKQQFYPAK